jgi:hypothetical protein
MSRRSTAIASCHLSGVTYRAIIPVACQVGTPDRYSPDR